MNYLVNVNKITLVVIIFFKEPNLGLKYFNFWFDCLSYKGIIHC